MTRLSVFAYRWRRERCAGDDRHVYHAFVVRGGVDRRGGMHAASPHSASYREKKRLTFWAGSAERTIHNREGRCQCRHSLFFSIGKS